MENKTEEKSVSMKKLIHAAGEEVEATQSISEGKIKTISYSKIKKENKIKFNF